MAEYKLHLGDCLAVMRDIPDDSIDLTVTSPPYDNLRTYNGYTFDFEPIAQQLYRVTKPGGVVVWIVTDQTIDGNETGTSFRQALYFRDVCGFNLHDTMIWDKQDCQFPDTVRYYNHFEFMFVLSKGRPNTVNQLTKPNKKAGKTATWNERQRTGEFRKAYPKPIKKFGVRGNVWRIHSQKARGTTDNHPAVFPVQLARDHVRSWSNAGDTVFDPFMGSGTTGVACMLTGRCFLGVEIDEQYHTLAEQRIADAARQARGEFTPVSDEQVHDDLPLFAG